MSIWSFFVGVLIGAFLYGFPTTLAATFAELPLQLQAPPVPVLPPEDPERIRLEEKLKDLQRKENGTQDLSLKARLLGDIIELCIELGRDYSPYQAQLTAIREELDRRSAQTSEQQQNQQKNRALKDDALAALASARLEDAAAATAAAMALFPGDAETLALQRRVNRDMWNRRVRRVSIGSLVAAVVGGALLLIVARVRKGGRARELEMVEGPQPGELFALQKGTTVLGAAEADVVINDPLRRISRRHCEIARTGRHYFVTDRSTNGTWINGVAAPKGEPVLLRKGDTIELSENVILRFR